MIKLILGAIVAVATLAVLVLRLWFSVSAEKKSLLKKIRKLEYEMSKYPVGSDKYNWLRAKWLQRNRRWGDITRHS